MCDNDIQILFMASITFYYLKPQLLSHYYKILIFCLFSFLINRFLKNAAIIVWSSVREIEKKQIAKKYNRLKIFFFCIEF